MAEEKNEYQLSFPVSVSGLDEEHGTAVGQYVGDFIREAAALLDLRDLEGVTITDDYANAVADFDCGFETKTDKRPTEENFATGVAMAIPTKRGNDFKSHMVIDVRVAYNLVYAGDDDQKAEATGLLLHELAHVHDQRKFSQAFPDQMFKPLPDVCQGWLYGVSSPVWSEYFACCVSAKQDPKRLNAYLETFFKAVEECPETVRQAVITYRTNSDLDGLVQLIFDRLGIVFKFASYVIGHLEGLQKPLSELDAAAYTRLEMTNFIDAWDGLTIALQEMHDQYPGWTSLSIYDPIGAVFMEFLEKNNLFFKQTEAGFEVDIPFTMDTMPPEGQAWLAAQNPEVN